MQTVQIATASRVRTRYVIKTLFSFHSTKDENISCEKISFYMLHASENMCIFCSNLFDILYLK